jgi:serine/threonine-protein kinase
MGVVYVVEHARTGDQLALKLLHGRAARDPASIERFKREARASARIKSDHVVKVVDADVAPELENAPFLVMELLDGLDLDKLVAQRGRLSPAETFDYLTQAARALDKSHALGIVHRDLKPENLFLHRREDGSTILKILDFGISKIVGGEGANDMTGAGMTSTGAIMGTPLYMAPEQARGQVSLIAATTDVWAVGLIVLHLLTGQIYWQSNTVAELMVQILAEPLYPPTRRWPWLPPGIDAWFARSCARDPAQRFPAVGAQVEALAVALGLRAPAFASTFLAQAPAAAPILAPMPVPMAATPLPGGSTTTHPHALGATGAVPPPPRSHALPVALAVLGIIVLAGGGGAAWLSRDRLAGHPPVAPSATEVPPSAPLRLPPVGADVAVPAAASSTPVVAPPLDAAGSASARPAARAAARPVWTPPARPAPLPTGNPTFAPVSP